MFDKDVPSENPAVIDDSFGEADSVTFLPYSAFDSSRLATYAVSVALIVYGSFRSLNLDAHRAENGCHDRAGNRQQLPHWCNWHVLGSWQAALMPLAASISLLLMFLYFESLQLIFVIATCVLATAAFTFLLLPLCQMFLGNCSSNNHLRTSGNSSFCAGRYQPSEIVSACLGAALVSAWLVTGHWLLMDLLAMGLCVAFIALVRLPSLKVSTLLLVGLLLYDIFWVFFSTYLFSTNVMVRVATRTIDSPIAMFVSDASGLFYYLLRNIVLKIAVGSTAEPVNRERHQQFVLRSAGSSPMSVHRYERVSNHQHFMGNPINQGYSGGATKLSLPGKLVFPSWQSGRYTMLGLGDIVVPGLLLCFVLRYDAFKRKHCINPKSVSASHLESSATYISSNRLTYFRCSLVGYFFGLITATVCSEVFRSAQPALLYLVPFTLIPLVFMSYARGDLRLMWHGNAIDFDLSVDNWKGSSSSSSLLLSSHSEPNLSLGNRISIEVPPPPPPEFDCPPPYTPLIEDSILQSSNSDNKCSV